MTRQAPPCHIGIAFYTYPTAVTQWVLVLSENPLFEGKVWCNTVIETERLGDPVGAVRLVASCLQSHGALLGRCPHCAGPRSYEQH